MNLINIRFDFVKNAKKLIFLSLALLIAGISSLIIKGGFSVGIDFAGGKNIRVKIDSSLSTSAEKLRDILASAGDGISLISIGDEADQEFFISFKEEEGTSLLTQNINLALNENLGQDKWTLLSEDFVGPKIGKEFQKTAVQATLIILAILLAYIALRFQFKFGVVAVLALAHDVIITLGFISLLNLQFDTSILAAVLTILGYSINDTIVIFDRIREESKNFKVEASEYKGLVNTSIKKSLSRTIMTSLTTFFALIALVALGGIELRPMALVMGLGVIIGTFSSNFVAGPLLVFWENYSDKKKKTLKTKKS